MRLRRSCASLFNAIGIDGKVVADQLGHALDVNQNVYTKVGQARQRDAETILDQALSGPGGVTTEAPA